MEKEWRKNFEKGTLKFHLKGGRLNGPYLLAWMKEEPNWMLKMLNPAIHPQASFAAVRETPAYVAPQFVPLITNSPLALCILLKRLS